ncbi:tyrosine-type recombinase/integrase [Histophilus somni]|uniref:tyrosine-type recombinase/integrase n=1 Tax=Histophilus somni TaxID=731 RepID=UPI00201F2FDD|nr:tyrosine-type recombinase/integrase [Histophilus somni]
MSIRKRGENYTVEVRLKNQAPIYRTFATKKEAEQFEFEYRDSLSDGEIMLKKTFAEACDRYLEEITPTRKGWRWERLRINKFKKDSMAYDQINLITKRDIEGFIAKRKKAGLKNGSILRELGLISSIFREAINWRYCAHNPVKLARKPRNDKPRKRRISQQEINKICVQLDYDPNGNISNTKQATAAAFLLAIETGMRQGEIFSLEWEHVHLQDCFVELFETKNGDDRIVPLSDKAIEIMHQFKQLNRLNLNKARVIPYNQASAGTLFRRALKEIGIMDLHFHDSRHEACSRLAKINGMTPILLGKIMGHRDPRSLMIYFNPTGRDLAQAIRQGYRY